MVATAERLVVKELDVDVLDSGVWTFFEDAYAEGNLKFKEFSWIIVQAEQEKAIEMFKAFTNVDPQRVTCTCCGQHYSIREHDSVFQATAFERSCRYDKELKCYVEAEDDFVVYGYKSLEEFLTQDNVLIIYADGSLSKSIH